MKHVLIVDDDTWQADHFSRALLATGMYTASHASDAIAALECIDDSIPDVLVLDMLLPGPNGLTLLHELQSHTDLANIPVVLVSSHIDYHLEDVRPYGVVALLDKTTIDDASFVRAVQRATT